MTVRCPPGRIFPLSLISGTSARRAMEAFLSRYLSLATGGRGHMSGRVSSFKLRHYPCRKAALSCPTKNETRKLVSASTAGIRQWATGSNLCILKSSKRRIGPSVGRLRLFSSRSASFVMR